MERISRWIKVLLIILSVFSGKDDISMKNKREVNEYKETQKVITLMKQRFEDQVYFSRSDIRMIDSYLDKRNVSPEAKEIKQVIIGIYTGFALDRQVAKSNETEVQKEVYDFYLQEILRVEENLKVE